MNKETKQLMVVGEIREALNKLEIILKAGVSITMPITKQKEWEELNKQYDAFYELSLVDRLVASGINKKGTK